MSVGALLAAPWARMLLALGAWLGILILVRQALDRVAMGYERGTSDDCQRL
jgi:hypothetical protein